MNREIENRKKRFLSFCMAFMILLVQVIPVNISAETYDADTDIIQDETFLLPGDIVEYYHSPGVSDTEINYYDADGADGLILLASESNTSDTSESAQFVVKDYDGTQLSAEEFRGWKVTSIYCSSGALGFINLQATSYTSSNISYELDGGENDPSNPSSYYEGKEEIVLADATKDGYTFAGWYTDNAFTNKVTSISTSMTGDITLYAKFLAKYNITYELDDGVNGANPDKYTAEIGVSSFADASKEGYSFEGWYSDAEFKTVVTSIPSTQTGDVTLYAKFTINEYTINYVLDGGSNSEDNPGSYIYGEGVASFADASKEGYTFEGWYSDAEFKTQVTSITTTQLDDVTLYAKFTVNDYNITYVLDGGTNGAGNPYTYTYGVGVTSFADASKTGYTFEGWYSDAELKTQVTSISATQLDDVTLYAKFTVNEYNINYVLDGGSNSEDNPGSYIYGEGVASFADASKEGYTFEGWYSDETFTTEVTSISETQTEDVTLYAKFVFIQLEGSGTVVINDLYYGEEIAPIITSSTNGTDNVIIQYKEKDADDDTYTYIKPSTVGEYTVRVVFAETEEYLQVTATDDFVISYLSEPDSSLSFNGTLGENDFYTSSVFILPLEGYLISDSLDGNYTDKLEIIQTTNLFLVYLKNTATGATTDGINVSEIKIDSAVPVISNAASGDVIYGEYAQITVTDDNLSQVMVNGSAVDFEDGEAVLLLYSNQGKEQYTITATDLAGNKSEISIVVAAEWMKTGVIPSGSKVKLYKGNAYTLGEGSWKIDGDDTVYAGNITFYVDEDGEYVFTKAE